jgi:hypothetical protein
MTRRLPLAERLRGEVVEILRARLLVDRATIRPPA